MFQKFLKLIANGVTFIAVGYTANTVYYSVAIPAPWAGISAAIIAICGFYISTLVCSKL